jgi:hypothetical protein
MLLLRETIIEVLRPDAESSPDNRRSSRKKQGMGDLK